MLFLVFCTIFDGLKVDQSIFPCRRETKWHLIICFWYVPFRVRLWWERWEIYWRLVQPFSPSVKYRVSCLNYDFFKVHLTPKYFFRSNKSLHLFETHCAFLLPFNPNLDFLQAVKVTKSGHHLLHDRASKGYGSIPGLTSQTSLHACLQRLNTMQISLWRPPRKRPIPLTCSVVQQIMARFQNFYSL